MTKKEASEPKENNKESQKRIYYKNPRQKIYLRLT